MILGCWRRERGPGSEGHRAFWGQRPSGSAVPAARQQPGHWRQAGTAAVALQCGAANTPCGHDPQDHVWPSVPFSLQEEARSSSASSLPLSSQEPRRGARWGESQRGGRLQPQVHSPGTHGKDGGGIELSSARPAWTWLDGVEPALLPGPLCCHQLEGGCGPQAEVPTRALGVFRLR